ncbi:MAG: twin-arginine translocase TatA/TatE family subunit [Candidatus Korobacteraceae bacterium]|jgi:sec-independent protein translocase protein TatA
MHLGMPELLLIFAIALLLFGPKKLGELGKGLGEGIRNFKSGLGGSPEPEAKPPSAAPPSAPAETKVIVVEETKPAVEEKK